MAVQGSVASLSYKVRPLFELKHFELGSISTESLQQIYADLKIYGKSQYNRKDF